MKGFLIALGIAIALVLVIVAGMLLYKHFITDQIRDKGGMENPNYIADVDSTSIAESTEDEAQNSDAF